MVRGGWLLLLAGCAGSSTPTTPAAPAPADVDAAMGLWAPEPTGVAPSRTLPTLASTVTLRPSEKATPRRRSGRRVDVDLHRASLAQALQFLADEARVNLVLANGVAGDVSLSLRRVDPLEALEALAAAQNLDVEQRGSILIVRKR